MEDGEPCVLAPSVHHESYQVFKFVGSAHEVGRCRLKLLESRVESAWSQRWELKYDARTVNCFFNRPISVYRSPRRTLTLCPQLCMGIQPSARCSARSADLLSATLYGHFTKAIELYRNRPILPKLAYFTIFDFNWRRYSKERHAVLKGDLDGCALSCRGAVARMNVVCEKWAHRKADAEAHTACTYSVESEVRRCRLTQYNPC